MCIYLGNFLIFANRSRSKENSPTNTIKFKVNIAKLRVEDLLGTLQNEIQISLNLQGGGRLRPGPRLSKFECSDPELIRGGGM